MEAVSAARRERRRRFAAWCPHKNGLAFRNRMPAQDRGFRRRWQAGRMAESDGVAAPDSRQLFSIDSSFDT